MLFLLPLEQSRCNGKRIWVEREKGSHYKAELQNREAMQCQSCKMWKVASFDGIMNICSKEVKPFFLTLCSKMLVYLLSKNNISFETLPQCNILTFFYSWPSSSFNSVKLMENKWAAKWVLNCNAVKFIRIIFYEFNSISLSNSILGI